MMMIFIIIINCILLFAFKCYFTSLWPHFNWRSASWEPLFYNTGCYMWRSAYILDEINAGLQNTVSFFVYCVSLF